MKNKQNPSETAQLRPPVVAILGHVDHGKTTLLDYIRKSHVAQKEHGGITQHIGAYQITVSLQDEPLSRATEGSRGIPSKSKKILRPVRLAQGKQAQVDHAQELRTITFIDTPGHEAFAKMRSRGVAAADIAILVVAGNDGVMPQTQEAISHIKKAGIPLVVAVTKIDLPDVDLPKVKQQLARSDVLVEGFGGDVVVVPVSGKTGQGVKELLEVILLVSQMKEIKGNPQSKLTGIVVETKHDRHRGVLATVIVKDGMLKVGDIVYAESAKAKIRSLVDSLGLQVEEAPPSFPVEVMGWESLPQVGSIVTREVPISAVQQVKLASPYSFSLPPLTETKKLKLILKTDVLGTLEAIKESLKGDVEWIATGSGDINESDVLLAKSTAAFVIGFNVKLTSSALKLAEVERVKVKTYTIVYDLLDEVNEVIKILTEPAKEEQVLGEVVVLAVFDIRGEGIAGCRVKSGKISKNDTVKVIRGENVLSYTRIKSLKRGKEDIGEALAGTECGLTFDKKLDFKVDDLIIAYRRHQLLA